MDSERFDGLIRAFGASATRRGALAWLAGVAGLGIGETSARRKKRSNGKQRVHAAEADKVTICHRTGSAKKPFQVITVAASAVPAHAAHGDLVSCPNLQVIDFESCTCICPVDDITCGLGQVLDLTECKCVEGECSAAEEYICGRALLQCGTPSPGERYCACVATEEGQPFCGGITQAVDTCSSTVVRCDSTDDCPEGLYCSSPGCCPTGGKKGLCYRECGAAAASARRATAGEETGATFTGR
jgi:hypothetical protein